MTQIIKSNTGVMQSLISIGTYDGNNCDPANFMEDYSINEDFKNGDTDYLSGEYWENFDNSKYMEELKRLANSFIQENIAPAVVDLDIGIKSIKGVGTWSPREYNFATDELILEIEVGDDFQETSILVIQNLGQNEVTSYEKYLKRHCTSYDGFSSFVSNKIPDIIDEIRGDINATELDCFIDWYIEYHCDEDWSNGWTDYLHENIYARSFLPDDFEPISRKLIEAYSPLVAARATEPQSKYQNIDECIDQILEEHPPSDFDIDELRLSELDERAMRDFLVRELRECWLLPTGTQIIPGLEGVA